MRARITAVLSAGERPVTMDRARLECQMREIALEHAAARLDDEEYLTRMAHLRGELEVVGAKLARDLPARRAAEWLDALAETWQKADLVEEKSDVIHAAYERIVVEGPPFVGLRLTPGGQLARPGAGATGKAANGAPDRCWTREHFHPRINRSDAINGGDAIGVGESHRRRPEGNAIGDGDLVGIELGAHADEAVDLVGHRAEHHEGPDADRDAGDG